MTDTKSQIGFDEAGLGGMLKQYQLSVPANQREYAWTSTQVTQLFNDFAKALLDGEQAYFLGTIVTIPRASGTLEVVDGQQRLATTAILLAAIRDYLVGKEPMIVEAINNEFLTGIDRTQRARVPRLKLNIDDNQFFGWLLTKDGMKPEATKPSHERLVAASEEAIKRVRSIVSGLDPKDHGDALEQWVQFIEHRAKAVLLRVPNDANAYKMFETLNDRGLRVSQADLIKNYLFGRSGTRFNEVQAKWSYMRGTLESLDEQDITVNFLRHALIAMRGYLREAGVYDAVQDQVKGEPAAVTFAATLENLATAYVATHNPEHEKWNGHPDAVRRSIEVLNLLGVRPLRPLLLSIAAKFDQKETALAFQFIVSLAVRLVIGGGTRSGSVEVPVATAANEVFIGKIATALDLKKRLSDITPSNEEFKEAVTNCRVSVARFARYYLRSMEMAAKGEAEPWFVPTDDRAVINLEHVLPKKPGDNWPQFTAEEADHWLTRLGNQVLMRASDNSDLRSAAFAEKKKVFANSPYVLTSHVASFANWTPQAIAERQLKLGELAVKTWPV